jgi:serine/threonine protein kinase
MVLMMAEALAEAHQKGLRYVSVRPANVLIHQGEPRLYPIDFSSWVASAAHAQGSLSFTMDTLEYLAPEYFVKNAGREEFLKPERDRIKDEFEIAKRAQQYALGMVALAMLEGRPPVKVQALTDIERLLAFQADPRNFSIDGRSRELRNRPWRRAAPGFARVIWRMLEHDPGERWEDMNVVAAQLRLVLNDFTDVPAHVSEAKKIYLCSLRQNKDFYLWVSKRFFRLAPNIKPMFVEVDAKGRQALLDGVLRQLLNYRANQQEPTTLTEIAEQLQKFHLSREHFDLFGQVFVEALIEVENTIPSALDAWEAVLWPGIEYLKRYAGDGASVDKENTH